MTSPDGDGPNPDEDGPVAVDEGPVAVGDQPAPDDVGPVADDVPADPDGDGATRDGGDRLATARRTGRGLYAVVQDAELGLLAAAVAYFAFVSLVPLATLLLALGTLVGGDALAESIIAAFGRVLSPGGEDAVTDAMAGGAGRLEISIVGVAVFGWGALKVFRALDAGFSRIHRSEKAEGFVSRSVDAVVALAATGLGTGVTVVAGALIVGATGVAFVGALAPVALFIALVVVFLPLYRVFPDVPMATREAVPGAVVAAAGWTTLVTGYGLYAMVAPDYALYGVLGAALLLVTWFYLAAWVLLVGAAVNAVARGDGAAGKAG